jgi:copper chaperone
MSAGVTATARLRVKGMHCGSCGILIDEALEGIPGVRSSDTDARSGSCTVEFDPRATGLAQITAEITALGYTVEPAQT